MRNQMQRYDNPPGNPDFREGISGYMLLKLNLNQFTIMSKCGLAAGDARHVPMYEEYLSLRRDGVPKERIYQHFRSKYHVSESTVKRVVQRLSRRVTP